MAISTSWISCARLKVSVIILVGVYNIPVIFMVYGDKVEDNILQSLPRGWMRTTTEIMITAHVILAFIMVLNPVAQGLEDNFHIPQSK